MEQKVVGHDVGEWNGGWGEEAGPSVYVCGSLLFWSPGDFWCCPAVVLVSVGVVKGGQLPVGLYTAMARDPAGRHQAHGSPHNEELWL